MCLCVYTRVCHLFIVVQARVTFPFTVLLVFYECLPVYVLLYIKVCAVNCTWWSDAGQGEDLVLGAPREGRTVCHGPAPQKTG